METACKWRSDGHGYYEQVHAANCDENLLPDHPDWQACDLPGCAPGPEAEDFDCDL